MLWYNAYSFCCHAYSLPNMLQISVLISAIFIFWIPLFLTFDATIVLEILGLNSGFQMNQVSATF